MGCASSADASYQHQHQHQHPPTPARDTAARRASDAEGQLPRPPELPTTGAPASHETNSQNSGSAMPFALSDALGRTVEDEGSLHAIAPSPGNTSGHRPGEHRHDHHRHHHHHQHQHRAGSPAASVGGGVESTSGTRRTSSMRRQGPRQRSNTGHVVSTNPLKARVELSNPQGTSGHDLLDGPAPDANLLPPPLASSPGSSRTNQRTSTTSAGGAVGVRSTSQRDRATNVSASRRPPRGASSSARTKSQSTRSRGGTSVFDSPGGMQKSWADIFSTQGRSGAQGHSASGLPPNANNFSPGASGSHHRGAALANDESNPFRNASGGDSQMLSAAEFRIQGAVATLEGASDDQYRSLHHLFIDPPPPECTAESSITVVRDRKSGTAVYSHLRSAQEVTRVAAWLDEYLPQTATAAVAAASIARASGSTAATERPELPPLLAQMPLGSQAATGIPREREDPGDVSGFFQSLPALVQAVSVVGDGADNREGSGFHRKPQLLSSTVQEVTSSVVVELPSTLNANHDSSAPALAPSSSQLLASSPGGRAGVSSWVHAGSPSVATAPDFQQASPPTGGGSAPGVRYLVGRYPLPPLRLVAVVTDHARLKHMRNGRIGCAMIEDSRAAVLRTRGMPSASVSFAIKSPTNRRPPAAHDGVSTVSPTVGRFSATGLRPTSSQTPGTRATSPRLVACAPAPIGILRELAFPVLDPEYVVVERRLSPHSTHVHSAGVTLVESRSASALATAVDSLPSAHSGLGFAGSRSLVRSGAGAVPAVSAAATADGAEIPGGGGGGMSDSSDDPPQPADGATSPPQGMLQRSETVPFDNRPAGLGDRALSDGSLGPRNPTMLTAVSSSSGTVATSSFKSHAGGEGAAPLGPHSD